MNILTLRKLWGLLQKTNLTSSTKYKETPMYAVKMLIYIAMYQQDHPIYWDELVRTLDLNRDKVLRAAREYLKDYIAYKVLPRPNIRRPSKAFYLTPKGEQYVSNLVEELE